MAASAASPRYIPLSIEQGGQIWNGSWRLEGDVVHVSSAYGSKGEPIGAQRRRPEEIAARLFRDILRDRMARRGG